MSMPTQRDRSVFPRACRAALVIAGIVLGEAKAAQASGPDVVSFGQATPGTRGFPWLSMEGAPILGRPFALRLRHRLAGAGGVLFVADEIEPLVLPAFGAVLHAGRPLSLVELVLDEAGCSGSLLAMSAVPPSLGGMQLVVQALVLDPAAAGGVAFTRAARLRFGADPGAAVFPAVQESVEPNLSFSIQNGLWDVAVGDLNGDQLPDLVGITPGSGIFVFLSREDGTRVELPAFDPLVGGSLKSIELFDLDGDLHLDALVTDHGGSLNVFRGVGDGTFTTWRTFPVSPRPGRFVLADFDVDGRCDVAVIDVDFVTPQAGQLNVLRGQPDAVFTPTWTAALGRFTRWVEAGDVDGDGLLDLVTAEEFPQVVRLVRGRGDGTFEAPEEVFSYTSVFDPSPVALDLGDLDGDGHLDLVTANKIRPFPSGVLEVRLGDGTGAFGAPTRIPTGDETVPSSYQSEFEIHLVDVDGDLELDALVASRRVLEVLLGRGDGTFDPPVSFGDPGSVGSGQGLASIAVCDLNGDLLPDVVGGEAKSFPVRFAVFENTLLEATVRGPSPTSGSGTAVAED